MIFVDFLIKNNISRDWPPICVFCAFTNGNDKIYWVDPDGFRKNSYFIMINKKNEVIGVLSFEDFYQNIDYLKKKGWHNDGSFIKDIKSWIPGFAKKYNILYKQKRHKYKNKKIENKNKHNRRD